MIHILSPEIANRIAAGEVVERPASVVRELIDNAVDAGATRIDIEVEDGGLGLIRVTDNGSGMNREDIELSVKRHATSKIMDSDDLEAISTRGFRGEALAAISSVAKFELKTRQLDEQLGYSIYVEGGKEYPVKEAGTPVGTTVSIRDLFYNVPARRKFLKKPTTELSHVLSTITWNALAHEKIHFTFSKGGRRSLDYPGVSNRPERIQQIFGREIIDDLIPLHYDSPDVVITGFISRPTLTRNTAQQVFFFVNDRYIKDRLLHSAMMQGYRSLIPAGRYPVVFLFYEVNPGDIDINVHPTKQEIKFSRENAMFSATYRAIRQAWDVEDSKQASVPQQGYLNDQTDAGPSEERPPEKITPPWQRDDWKNAPRPGDEKQAQERKASPIGHSKIDPFENKPVQETGKPDEAQPQTSGQKPENQTAAEVAQPEVRKEDKPQTEDDSSADNENEQDEKSADKSAKGSSAELAEKQPDSPQKQQVNPVEAVTSLNRRALENGSKAGQSGLDDLGRTDKRTDELFSVQSLEGVEPLTVLAQLMDCYILAQSSEGLFIIDQHAAHERLKFEEFLLAAQNKPMAGQPLLFPVTVDLGPDEVALLEEHLEFFGRFGFEIEAFGPQTFVIRSTPANLPMSDSEAFIKDLLGQIKEGGDAEEKRERALHTMACRAAVKFGDPLSMDEMKSIISGLERIPRRNVCPHGRPSILQVSDHQLRKLFKRLGF